MMIFTRKQVFGSSPGSRSGLFCRSFWLLRTSAAPTMHVVARTKLSMDLNGFDS